MANAPSSPTQVNASPQQDAVAEGKTTVEQALVPLGHPEGAAEFHGLEGPVTRLPVELDVAVPIEKFRVRNLLALASGQVVETGWGHGEDVPLAAGAVQLAWSEFEVIDTQLAVRITRLA
jgi:flagellar motor switch protein FliN/FliY